ncbi:cell division regulator GpsB [Salsuginibacillus halophilus]
MKGYNKDEVDKFLDTVIQDYEAFQDRVEELEQEVERLKKKAPQPVSRAQSTNEEPNEQPAARVAGGNTNYDILKRLSNLEKEVFGRKLHDQDPED